MSGQLRCNSKLNRCDKAHFAAQKIFNSPIVDKDLINEAHLISGRCFVSEENYAEARTELALVSKRTNSEMTAESRYLTAFVEFKEANYKESQKLIIEIQKQVPSYDYWIAKGFILLGDNYLALKDTFQAKETYKSIVENYEADPADADDLKSIANEKLKLLLLAEKNMDAEKQKLKMELAPKDSSENGN